MLLFPYFFFAFLLYVPNEGTVHCDWRNFYNSYKNNIFNGISDLCCRKIQIFIWHILYAIIWALCCMLQKKGYEILWCKNISSLFFRKKWGKTIPTWKIIFFWLFVWCFALKNLFLLWQIDMQSFNKIKGVVRIPECC